MKAAILIIISLLIGLGAGFFAGQEYTKNRIAAEFEKAFKAPKQKENEINSAANRVQEEQSNLDKELKELNKIEKNVGDEVTLATIKLKINSVKEETMIQSSDNPPRVADQGTKFVIINMTITNISKAPFQFEARDLLLIDDKGTKYTPYGETIGNIGDYLDYQTLSQIFQKRVWWYTNCRRLLRVIALL